MGRCTFKDLTGEKYGLLTVLYRGDNILGRSAWVCKCECGNEKLIRGDSMKQGGTTSCGCVVRAIASQRMREMHADPDYVTANKSHGMSNTPTYTAYRSMLNSCYNSNLAVYKFYGAKGVTVCESWREGFNQFLADVGERPSEDFTLQRKDKQGNYTPDNVHWALGGTQQRGRCIMSNNTSGKAGVGFVELYNQWQARYSCPITKKLLTKTFAVKKYGYEEAFRLACEWRDARVAEASNGGTIYDV